jgi:hypothetical protein
MSVSELYLADTTGERPAEFIDTGDPDVAPRARVSVGEVLEGEPDEWWPTPS